MNRPSNINIHPIAAQDLQQQSAVARQVEQKEELIDLGKYLKAVWKRWPMILGFTFLAALLATLVAYSITPVYRSTAVLLIEAEQRNAVSIGEVIGVDTSKQEYYLTQFELLKSRTIAQKVIEKYQLAKLPEFNGEKELTTLDKFKNPIRTLRELAFDSALLQSWLPPKQVPSELDAEEGISHKVMGAFRKRLSISPIRKTQLVNISFESEDKRLAAILANAVGEAYIENNREAQLQASQEATTWLEDRLAGLKNIVTLSESRLATFLEGEGLVDVSGIDSLASAELSDISRRLSDARDRRVAAESLYYVLQDNRNAGLAELSSIPAISNHPQLRDVRMAEIEAERLVSELSKRYGPKHDKMIQAQAQLASVKDRTRKVLNSLATGIEKELRGARKQENAIQAELNSKKDQFQGIAVKRATYDALKREVESNRKLYDLFLNRQKETSATTDFRASVARFSDFASVPLVPIKPNKGMLLFLTTLAGLVGASLLAILLESFRDTVEQVKDIEDSLHLTPLGEIPLVKNGMNKSQAASVDAYFNDNFRAFSEAIRTIRTTVMLNMVSADKNLLAITSSMPGEGKTTLSISLAESIAKLEKTLLIDCDLRRPSIGGRFSLSKSHLGLTNILLMNADIDDCLYFHEKSGLNVLPAGMVVHNPLELLSGAKFASLLKQLSSRYQKIIFDTPPVGVVSDGLIIGQLTHSSIVVANAGKTKINQIEKTISKLSNHGVTVRGVVLNKASIKNKAEYYYYGSNS